jgi:hypothetical protein
MAILGKKKIGVARLAQEARAAASIAVDGVSIVAVFDARANVAISAPRPSARRETGIGVAVVAVVALLAGLDPAVAAAALVKRRPVDAPRKNEERQ